MFIKIKSIKERSKELPQIMALYHRAFPENERKTLSPLLQDDTGHGEVLAFYHEENFLGFACLLHSHDVSHMIYFAMVEFLRGKGYGKACLASLLQMYPHRMIVDIEIEDAQKANHEQRHKRKQFYLKNGFQNTAISYTWEAETYEIMAYGGTVTSTDFEHFWDDIYAHKELQIY